MTEDKILKAALYIRVSTEEQASEGYSIEAQKEKLLAFCKSQDWTVYNIYADEGYSAKDLNRPAIQKLIHDAESKYFEVIVFYKLDRVSRSLKDLTGLIDKFEKVNVKIKSLTEPFDTTSPPGKLMLNMLGSFAQFEREIIGERTKLGLHRAFEEGKWVTAPPFGYKIADGKLVINETEAVIVRKIIDLFLKDNLGIKAIMRVLNKEDIISTRRNKWSKTSVWKILKSPVYYGYAEWKGKVVEREHATIITKEIFDEIQNRLDKRNKIPPRAATTTNLLLGLIKCGKCGSKLAPSAGKQHKYYACRGRENGCDLPYIPKNDLEKALVLEIAKVSREKKVIGDALKELSDRNERETKGLKKEYLLLKKKVEKAKKGRDKKIKWLSDTLPDKATTNNISREISAVEAKIREIEEKLTQIDVALKEKETSHIQAEMVSSFLENFINFFGEWDTRKRRLLLASIVKEVIVLDKESAKALLSIPLLSSPDYLIRLDKEPSLTTDVATMVNDYALCKIWGR